MEPNVATAAKPVKIPGPDHPITIERNPARIIVSIAGRIAVIGAIAFVRAVSGASARSTRCGVMRTLTLPSRRSGIISPSTPSVLTRSKNDQRPDHPSLYALALTTSWR